MAEKVRIKISCKDAALPKSTSVENKSDNPTFHYFSVLGTAAMFLVGGGIFSHGWQSLQGLIETIAHHAAQIPGLGGLLKGIPPPLLGAAVGIVIGAIILAGVSAGGCIRDAGKKV